MPESNSPSDEVTPLARLTTVAALLHAARDQLMQLQLPSAHDRELTYLEEDITCLHQRIVGFTRVVNNNNN